MWNRLGVTGKNQMPIDLKRRPWWLEPRSADAAEHEAEGGLSGAEAEARLARFGPNLFRARPEKSLLRQYLARFKNPLVIILLVASAVSAFTGEVANFLIISFIVLLSVTLDFVQEYRANAAAKKLRLSVSRTRHRAARWQAGGGCGDPGGARRRGAAFRRRSDSGRRTSAGSA